MDFVFQILYYDINSSLKSCQYFLDFIFQFLHKKYRIYNPAFYLILNLYFIFPYKGVGATDLRSAAPVFMYIYFMNLTLGYIAFLASSFLSLNVTLFCSKRLSPLASIDTIRGPNSLTLQHHNVSGIPSSSQ